MLKLLAGHSFALLTALGSLAGAQEPPALDSAPEAAEDLTPQDEITAVETEEPKKEFKQSQDKHVISQSRVFSVSGGDAMRMGAIASRADDVRGQLCRLLGFNTTKAYNISIRLLGKVTDERTYPRMSRQVDIIGDEPSLTLYIQAGGGIDVLELHKNIIAMSLYDFALREIDVQAFEGSISMPEWLVVGIEQSVLWRNGKIDRSLYQNLFDRSDILTPQQIINTDKPWDLDAASRQIYECSCAVIILGLLGQEGGAASLREMIKESLLNEGSAVEMIQQHFQEVGLTDASLVKWWALELAHLAVPKTTEAMTPLETEERLAEALCITYYDPITRLPEQVSFDDTYRFVKLDDWKTQMRPIPQALSSLSIRCFPSYRPFITEYIRAMELLIKKEDPDAVQDIIGPVRELREAYIKTSIRVRDYLDWYEITHTGKANESQFNSYLDTMNLLRTKQNTKASPISNYLRDIEELYQLPIGSPLPKMMLQDIEQSRTPLSTQP